MDKNKIISTLALLVAAICPGFAMAANLFDPTGGDVSLKVLGAIFGGLLDGGGSDPLVNAIKMFNGGVLLIGGVLAGYTIFSSTINTAHEGEILGKSYSSAWVPIRYTIGTAVVLPVIGGGYCVMQAIVMWLVVQGIGLADGVWGAFMSNPMSAANTTATTTNKEAISQVAQTAFRNSICYRSFQQATAGDSTGILKWASTYKYSIGAWKDVNGNVIGYVYGDSNSALRVNGCGTVQYPDAVDGGSGENIKNSNMNTNSSNSGLLGNIGAIFQPIDVSSINQAHRAETDALVDSMDKLAGQVIDKRKSGPLSPVDAKGFYAQIQAASDKYVADIKSKATNFGNTDAFSKMKASATNEGWMLGGAWFTRIIQINQQINDAVNMTPSGDRNSPQLDAALFSDASKFLQSADDVLAQSPSGTEGDSFNTIHKGDDVKGQSADTGGVIKKIEARILGAITTVNLYELQNDSRHPLIIIQDLGNRLETLCWAMMTVIAVPTAIAATALGPFAGGVQVGVQVLGWFVNFPIKMLMGAAYGAAYILPNMPFIIWIGCIVGWTLLVIEAVIAAPMWAIMHLHPGGQGFVADRAANGYSLVLSLLLRPVLMVFGLMASLVISSVIGEFINKTYFQIFVQNTGSASGFTALSSLAIGTILYVVIMFIFIRKCFGIIHQLPDQMLQWFGGQGSSLGQFAGEFASAADKGGAAAAAAGSAIGSAGAGAASGSLGAVFRYNDRNVKPEINSAGGMSGKSGGFNAWLARKQGAELGDDGRWRTAAGAQSYQQAKEGAEARETSARFGSEAAEFGSSIASGMSGEQKETFKNNFQGGLALAKAVGGKAAVDDFMSHMAEAKGNGFQDFGGSPASAAQSFGRQSITNAISEAGLGSGAQSYVSMAATRSDGSFSANRAGNAVRDIKNMTSGLNLQAADSALGQAANNSNINNLKQNATDLLKGLGDAGMAGDGSMKQEK